MHCTLHKAFFVESEKIRICANDNRHLTGAKRLAVRASVLVSLFSSRFPPPPDLDLDF